MPTYLSLVFCLLFSSHVIANTTMVFKQTLRDDGSVKKAVWTSETRDGITLIKGENFLDKIQVKAKQNDAFYWNTRSKDGKTHLTITKDKDLISIQGTHKNKPINKKIKNTGQSPWYPAPGLMLQTFAKSNYNKKEFYIFSSDDKKLVKMVAKKVGKSEIKINNAVYDAVHVEMTPPGFKAMFWKADLYFDAKTGNFLKYAGLLGPPGTPYVTMERIDISTH